MVLHTDITFLTYLALALMAPVGIIPSLIGLGGSLLGGLFNRKSAEEKAATRAQTTLATQQAKLAKARGGRESALFAQSQPIIGQLIPQLQALLTGDRDILTQRNAPALERLSGQRAGAQRRIEQSGPASGATAQASIELEKEQFRQQNALLSAAPQEAQAGLTQLLTLLLGGAAQQGQGATQAAATSAAGFESILASEGRNRLLGQQFFSSLASGAEDFGRSLFSSGGDISSLTAGDTAVPSLPNPGGLPGGNIGGGNTGGTSLLQLLKGIGGR